MQKHASIDKIPFLQFVEQYKYVELDSVLGRSLIVGGRRKEWKE
jgi:hypothetical protein